MCEVCAIFTIGEHWTDAGRPVHALYPAHDIQYYRRERRYRIALVNRILEKAGIACRCADWDGETFVVIDARGRQKVVPTLAAVWSQAAAFTGRICDPLALLAPSVEPAAGAT